MRFVKAFTDPITGELTHVRTSDLPFSEDDPPIHEGRLMPDGSFHRVDFQVHELGAIEDFAPTHPMTGATCPPSRHLIERLQRVDMLERPQRVADGRGAARFTAKPGHEAAIPPFHAVPVTVEGILAQLRACGPSAIPERVAHWLEFHRVLSGDQMDGARLPRLTIARAAEFDAVWSARHPSAGSRLETFKREARERIARRAALRARRRQPPGGSDQ